MQPFHKIKFKVKITTTKTNDQKHSKITKIKQKTKHRKTKEQ
jgi:hypothetical protein